VPKCPQCASERVWKDGWRGPIQRWLCRVCGYRFSEPKVKVNLAGEVSSLHSRSKLLKDRVVSRQFAFKESFNGLPFTFGEDVVSHKLTTVGKGLNTFAYNNCKRQVCASESEAKNLATVNEPRLEKAAGATTPDQATIKGLIAQYMAYLEKEGYYSGSSYPHLIRRLSKLGANLLDPEDVKKAIAKQPWKKSVKNLAVCAYDLMANKILKIQWDKPKYTPEETTPFVPEEKELDQLIAACRSRRMATFLQTLKETYADPGEILRLRWIDVDFSNSVITINSPVKGHKSGQMRVSTKLTAMLNSLPKKSEWIFPVKYDRIQNCFDYVRKRAAQRLQNPRLAQISFKTFRHWGGTMLAHYTHGNVLTVQRLLRHKNVQNTMKYIHMIAFKDDEFDVATATSLEEIKQLLSAGFEKADEFNGIHVFRRPKKFNG